MKERLGPAPAADGGCRFVVWAPRAERVELHLVAPVEATVPMASLERGYYAVTAPLTGPSARYFFRLDGGPDRPDPASRFQPEGVHGPSAVPEPVAGGDENWPGLPLEEYVIYEVHTGACTEEGTFEALIPLLDGWKEIGLTAVELMPVSQFPGGRNWGYDGVHPFAAQNTYGGPEALRRLVLECHSRGLAVILDVVYNHLGPEGNYLGEFGPYFTSAYRTAWGPAINLDGPHSDEVRRYLIENALYWLEEFRFDALRLDALHALIDRSAKTFLEELSEAVDALRRRTGRRVYLIGESDANDPRLLRSRARGGQGLDAVWSDDFHHALHVLLTGEQDGYYADFGRMEYLRRAWRDGFVYAGDYSGYRRRRHGGASTDLADHRFVICAQNHDQVGNRMLGERLSSLVSFEARKLAAAAVLLSPFIPLLFMGEEYGEEAPFLYFTSHLDPDLAEAVRRGRREEFSAFHDRGTAPDPQDPETFRRSRLHPDAARREPHGTLREFHRECLRLRRERALRRTGRHGEVLAWSESPRYLACRLGEGRAADLLLLCFDAGGARITLDLPGGDWTKALDSSEERWGGPGAAAPPVVESDPSAIPAASKRTIPMRPWSVVLYRGSRR